MTTNKQSPKNDYMIFCDEKASLYVPEKDIYIMYESVIDCSLTEKKGSMGKGGIARAFSSGLLGDHNYISTSLCIEIITATATTEIELIKTPIKSSTFIYKKLRSSATEIVNKINSLKPASAANSTLPDYIEELRELKKLVDEKILTEDEFQQRKQQLLEKH
jgi:hypothetical protein